jgi:hypothetical protein
MRRRTWPFRLGPYRALGQLFEVLLTDQHLASFLEHLYAPMAARITYDGGEIPVIHCALPPSQDRAGAVISDGKLVAPCYEPHEMLRLLQWAINRQVIEGACTDRLVLHAAAVESQGVAVVLPAAMEAGKTTLATGLLDRGCGYLTDEAAAVTPSLVVEGYLKPLSIDRGSWSVLKHHRPRPQRELAAYISQQWLVCPSGFADVVRESRLGVLIFPRYAKGARTHLGRVTPAAAVTHAAKSLFVHQRSQVSIDQVRALAVVAAKVPAYRLVSGDLGEACSAVLSVLARQPGSHQPQMRTEDTARRLDADARRPSSIASPSPRHKGLQ